MREGGKKEACVFCDLQLPIHQPCMGRPFSVVKYHRASAFAGGTLPYPTIPHRI